MSLFKDAAWGGQGHCLVPLLVLVDANCSAADELSSCKQNADHPAGRLPRSECMQQLLPDKCSMAPGRGRGTGGAVPTVFSQWIILVESS